MPNEKGELSREEMLQVMAEGGSVIHYGRIYTHPDHVPSEAELARDDPKRARAERDRLELQRRQLDDQIRMLEGTLSPQDDPRTALNPVETQERLRAGADTAGPAVGVPSDKPLEADLPAGGKKPKG